MTKEDLIPIACMLLLFIVIFIIIYFYFKRQQKLFFNYIQDKDYKIVKNVEADIETFSKISYRFSCRKTNAIFLGDEIFLVVIGKFISSGEILHIGRNFETFPGVNKKFTYHSKLKVGERIEIKGCFNQFVLNPDFKIALQLKNKNFDIGSVLN